MINPDAIKFVDVNGLSKSKDILKMSDNDLVDIGNGSYFHVSQLKKAILRKQSQEFMLDYKIEILDNSEINEILELFIKLGYTPYQDADFYLNNNAKFFFAEKNKFFYFVSLVNDYPVEYCSSCELQYFNSNENQEINLEQLREMVNYKDELK